MKVIATRRTAFAAGAWTSFSLTVFDMWAPYGNLNPRQVTLTYFFALLVLWIVPAVLFALGFDLKRWDPDYANQPQAQSDYREMAVRGAFWFGGSIACGLALRLVMT